MGSQSKRRGGGNKALEITLPYVRPTKIRGFRLRPLPFGEGHPRVETPTPKIQKVTKNAPNIQTNCNTPKIQRGWLRGPSLPPPRGLRVPSSCPTKIRGFRLRPLPFGEGHPRVETPTPCNTPRLHHRWPGLAPTRAALGARAGANRGQTGCSTPPKPQTHSYLAPPTEPPALLNPTNTMLPPSLPPRLPTPARGSPTPPLQEKHKRQRRKTTEHPTNTHPTNGAHAPIRP